MFHRCGSEKENASPVAVLPGDYRIIGEIINRAAGARQVEKRALEAESKELDQKREELDNEKEELREAC